MSAHLECHICGRTRETPWPEGPSYIYGWRTETECDPCFRRARLDRQYQVEDAMQTLFGKFTPEQLDALFVVMGKK